MRSQRQRYLRAGRDEGLTALFRGLVLQAQVKEYLFFTHAHTHTGPDFHVPEWNGCIALTWKHA